MARKSENIKVIVEVVGRGVSGGDTQGDNTGNAGTTGSKKIQPTWYKRYNQIRQVKNSPIASLARQVIGAEIQYHISGVGIATGDQYLQQNAERTWLKVNDGISVVGSAVSGIMVGAASGGPVGAILGGLVSVAGAGYNISLRERGLVREFQRVKFESDANVGLVRSRAELSTTTGRWRS